MNRWAVLIAVTALALASLPAAATTGGLSVAVLGDSYASGEGLADAEGLCGRSASAWGDVVAAELGATDVRVVACSGAQVGGVLDGGAGPGADQLERAAADGPVDLALLMIGGNDLGFVQLVAECLGFAELNAQTDPTQLEQGSWVDLVDSGAPGGCVVTLDDLLARVASFAGPDAFALPDGPGGLAELYVTVSERLLSEDGRLVVVGYPQLFADPARWPARYGQRCHGLRADDALLVSTVTAALDARIASEVERAGQLLGDRDRVSFVPVLDDFAASAGDHRLCSGDESWLHGLTVVEGGVDVAALLVQLGGGGEVDLAALGGRPGGSFHPNAAGHAAISAAVLRAVGDGGSG